MELRRRFAALFAARRGPRARSGGARGGRQGLDARGQGGAHRARALGRRGLRDRGRAGALPRHPQPRTRRPEPRPALRARGSSTPCSGSWRGRSRRPARARSSSTRRSKENVDYLARHRIPGSGTDVVADDGVVYRFFDGQGLTFHPLANASRLNALDQGRAGRTRRERSPPRSPTASLRAPDGAAVWEYQFDFGNAQGAVDVGHGAGGDGAGARPRGQARPRAPCLPRDPGRPRPGARRRAVDPALQQHRRHRPQRPAPERDLDRRLRRARGRRRRGRVLRAAARGGEDDAAALRHRPLVALLARRRRRRSATRTT